jgi:hypothetical protein
MRIPEILRLKYESLTGAGYYGFFYKALDLVLNEEYNKSGFNPYNYYEFGTGTGVTLTYYLKALKKIIKLKKLDLKKFRIFLFDSFEGLPEYTNPKDYNPIWVKGQFLGSEDYIKNLIKSLLPEALDNVSFVKGYYENTLNEELRKSLNQFPPSIVNIDVDYYTSTKTVLEWIYPILQDGTIFYFDDIYSYLGNLSKGEYRAIDEFNTHHASEGLHFYPFPNLGITSFTGRVFTFNRTVSDKS